MERRQRQFERFPLNEEAIAWDESGRRLGRVLAASGGGMSIGLENSSVTFTPGQPLRVTVIEPGRGIRHTVDVIVRYCNQNAMGVEFITGQAAQMPG